MRSRVFSSGSPQKTRAGAKRDERGSVAPARKARSRSAARGPATSAAMSRTSGTNSSRCPSPSTIGWSMRSRILRTASVGGKRRAMEGPPVSAERSRSRAGAGRLARGREGGARAGGRRGRGGRMQRAGFVYDPYGAEFQQRAHEIYRELRDLHPVYENSERGFFAISRFADVWQATQDVDALTTEGVE